MNILKVFDNHFHAKHEQEQFAIDNFYQLDSSDKYGNVTLLSGHSVYFRIVNTLEECHRLSGHCFSWIEFKGVFEPDIKQYLCSRVRG